MESRARKHLGERQPGEPFARWLIRLRPALSNNTALDEAIADHQRLAQLAAKLEAELRRRAGS